MSSKFVPFMLHFLFSNRSLLVCFIYVFFILIRLIYEFNICVSFCVRLLLFCIDALSFFWIVLLINLLLLFFFLFSCFKSFSFDLQCDILFFFILLHEVVSHLYFIFFYNPFIFFLKYFFTYNRLFWLVLTINGNSETHTLLPFSYLTDNELYSGTVADFSGLDPIIYREHLQTEQYDSLSLNGKWNSMKR